MALLSVETKSGEVIVRGNKLAELIEVIVLKKIDEIDKKYSTIIKIERNYFQYMNQLGSIYNISEVYDAAIKEVPSCLEIIEDVYNQSNYIDESEFIKFKIE
ncbi:hypothetical protein KXP69_002300 [Staphylococcus pseudintermedius]|nr:hypothetical protein [Staphylococcus pseudintermedius]MDE9937872.1 hypothetical protein [Staphylococcus pseudintermedius]